MAVAQAESMGAVVLVDMSAIILINRMGLTSQMVWWGINNTMMAVNHTGFIQTMEESQAEQVLTSNNGHLREQVSRQVSSTLAVAAAKVTQPLRQPLKQVPFNSS